MQNSKLVISVLKNAKIPNFAVNKGQPTHLFNPPKMNRPIFRVACLKPPPLESNREVSGAAAVSPLSSLWLLEAPPADVQEGKASFQVGRIFPPPAT